MTDDVKCGKCGSSNSADAKFCFSCGGKLQIGVPETKVICSACGIVNNALSVVCSGCGSVLVEEKKDIQEAQAEQEKKSSPNKSNLRPAIILFAGISLFIVAYEYLTVPIPEIVKGTLSQQSEMPQDHNHTDSGILQKINELEAALSANPTNKEMLLEFANRLQDARLFPRAIEAYKQYLQLNKSDGDARVDMGICYFESGNVEQAIREIESVINSSPKHQMAMFNLGIIYLNTSDLKKSNEWFIKCVEVNPSTEIAQRAKQILTQHKPN